MNIRPKKVIFFVCLIMLAAGARAATGKPRTEDVVVDVDAARVVVPRDPYGVLSAVSDEIAQKKPVFCAELHKKWLNFMAFLRKCVVGS